MELIGLGRTAEFYKLPNNRALKLFYPGISYHIAEIEYNKSKEVVKILPTVPKVFELKEIDGRYGIIFEKIDGDILSHKFVQYLFKVSILFDQFIQEQSKINNCIIDGVPSSIDVFRDKIDRSPVIGPDEKKLIKEFIVKTNKKCLCHGDYHPENIMVDKMGYFRVIDWLTAYSGNPMFDIARTYYLLRYGLSPERKKLYIKLLELFFRLRYSKVYLKRRLKDNHGEKYFEQYFFIIMLMRLEDGIVKENTKIIRWIKKKKTKTLRDIYQYCNEKPRGKPP